MTEVVDAEVVEQHREQAAVPTATQAIVPASPPSLAVTPEVKATELVGRLAVIREAQDQAMEKDVDYGVIPGTDKPTLLKPGAEKLSVLFMLDIQLANEKRWEEDGHLTVVSKAVVFHIPTGARMGYGEGICTTREKKYAKRTADLKCPSCAEATVKRSKREDEFYCWAKIGGCGAKFKLDDERITSQAVGEIDNPNLADAWNTVVKMAEKRARVDAVLAVTGASAIFTQDIEDMERPSGATSSKTSKPQTGFASDAQRGFTERLLGEAGFDTAGKAEVCDFMRSTMTKQEISSVIDRLKDPNARTEMADELGRKAAEFTKSLDPEAEPAQPDADDSDVPF